MSHSPCALPGARGRLGQSISASAQGAADSTGAAPVLTRGNPYPGFQESRTQERRGCTTLGGEGISTQDVQPGGQSWWEQEAGPRQPRVLGEQRASVPPLPDLLHLLFPISRGHSPAGMVTSHGSLHHSTGPGTTLPELHSPCHPPVSSKWQTHD